MTEQRSTLSPGVRPQVPSSPQPLRATPVLQPPQPLRTQPLQPLRPAPAPAPASQLPKVGTLAAQANKPSEPDLDPIGLVDEVANDPDEKKIKAFGVVGLQKAKQWKRKTTVTGQGAVRVKTFHGKLSDQGMQYVDDAINEWLDAHPEIEVKFVTSTVGQFEGKIREPALILNVWY